MAATFRLLRLPISYTRKEKLYEPGISHLVHPAGSYTMFKKYASAFMP